MTIIAFRALRSDTKLMKRHDPLDVPLYGLAEVARWVGVPVSTLRKWVYGRDYPAAGGKRRSHPLITPADVRAGLLSFANIAEAHILEATRQFHIPRADVRAAIDLWSKTDPSPHPLLTGKFHRFGKDIVVEFLNEKVSASRPHEGQPMLGDIFDAYLERIQRDESERILRFFPMRRNEHKRVMMDFDISGGQPVMTGTGVLVEVLFERKKAGESTRVIASDYGLSRRAVDEAIEYIAA